MEEIIEINDLNEAIWRNHYQLLVSDKKDTNCLNPFYGSAFRLLYKDKIWIVTADHVIHPDVHGIDESERKGEEHPYEYNYFLLNNQNVKGKLETILTTVQGFYYFDNLELMLDYSEQELKDADISIEDLFNRLVIAFCEQKTDFPYQCLTHSLQDGQGNLLVKAGLPKLIITSESVTEPSWDDKYYDYGVVLNDCSDGIRFNRYNVMYCDLKFGGECDSLYKFKYNGQIKYEEWAALSGSAIFNQEGKVVGMVIRVAQETNVVWAVPIKYIYRFIDYSINFENDHIIK